MNEKSPNWALRDLVGLILILLLAIALVAAAFVTAVTDTLGFLFFLGIAALLI